MEKHARSVAKAISWRATGSVDTFVISWLLTGSGKIAGSIASVEVVTKMVLYYFHERAWAWVRWGRAAPMRTEVPLDSAVMGAPAFIQVREANAREGV